MSGCRLFATLSLSGVLEVWIETYCEREWRRCARRRRTVVGERVPRELLPNGRVLVGLPAGARRVR